MKLELKHLSAYLPYGLKVFLDGVRETFKVDASGDKYHINEVTVKDVLTKPLKPILRPLSDLTKEIEHNGEKFVPLINIAYENWLVEGEDDISDVTCEEAGLYRVMHKNVEVLFFNPTQPTIHDYWIIERLFEWHFDVFGLIPEGLAIDVNSIE